MKPIDYQAKAKRLRAELKKLRLGAGKKILELQQQVASLESELAIANAMLAPYRERRDDDFADAVRFATVTDAKPFPVERSWVQGSNDGLNWVDHQPGAPTGHYRYMRQKPL